MLKILFTIPLAVFTIFCFGQCPIPTGLFTTNITFSNALANWTPVVGVDHYKIHYRIFGTSTWGNLGNIGINDSTRNLPLLQQTTTYEWEIMAYCDSTNQQSSSWSVNDTFTTPTFVAATFNPVIFNTLSSVQCDTSTNLTLNLMQLANEPDIGTSIIISDGGYFNIASLSIGDSIGLAILNTSSQTINSVLRVGFIAGQNYALINSYDSTGTLIGFFSIENELTGIKVSSISPNDGNNYTSGFTSEIHFNTIFITPNYAGPLHFYTDIESELNDQFYDTSTIIILCNSTEIAESKSEKKLVEIYDIYGRKSKQIRNKILFYHFSDGTIEKKLIIKK